jgi:phage shock protein PspC (stress-responsive transcriptional regulator)
MTKNAIQVLALSVLFVLLCMAFVSSGYLSFDGGLNFSVARQLVETGEYARSYSGLYPFPIETDGYFVFLAALAIAVFGTGPFAAQLPNAICMLGLFAVLYFLLRKNLLPLQSNACLFAAAATPGLFLFGFDGYGEIPMLLPVCGALALLAAQDAKRGTYFFWAGALFGLSVSTKVVALIFAPAFALCLFVLTVNSGFRFLFRAGGLFSAGFTCVYGTWELYRFISMGASRWLEWWFIRGAGITDRAGITGGLKDTPDIADKVLRHIDLLAGFYGLPEVVLYFAIAIILITASFNLARSAYAAFKSSSKDGSLNRSHAVTSLFLLVAGITYLVWWIVMTPTEQAWLRRLFLGLFCLHVAIPLNIFRLVNRSTILTRYVSPLLLVLIIATSVIQSGKAMLKEWKQYRSGIAHAALAVDYLSTMDNKAQLFGIGWYAAPQLSFHSGQTFSDLAMTVIGDIDFEHAYLVMDGNALHIMGNPSRSQFLYPSVLPQFTYAEVEQANMNPKVFRLTGLKPLADPLGVVPNKWNRENVEFLTANNMLQGVRLSRHGIVASSLVRGWIKTLSATNLVIAGALFPAGEYENKLANISGYDVMTLDVYADDVFMFSERVLPDAKFRFEVPIDIDQQIVLKIESNFVRRKAGVFGPQDPGQMSYVLQKICLN